MQHIESKQRAVGAVINQPQGQNCLFFIFCFEFIIYRSVAFVLHTHTDTTKSCKQNWELVKSFWERGLFVYSAFLSLSQ